MFIDPELVKQIAAHLPEDVQRVLKRFPGQLIVAGGFVRDFLTEAKPKDVDLFATSEAVMERAIEDFDMNAVEYGFHTPTKNTVSFCSPGNPTVQFIKRSYYPTVEELIESFDFTICQSAIYWNGEWVGICMPGFWEDVCDRVMHYTAPQREEDPGASLLRMVRFARRGYEIPEKDIAKVVGRFHGILAGEPEEKATEKVKTAFRNVGYGGRRT